MTANETRRGDRLSLVFTYVRVPQAALLHFSHLVGHVRLMIMLGEFASTTVMMHCDLGFDEHMAAENHEWLSEWMGGSEMMYPCNIPCVSLDPRQVARTALVLWGEVSQKSNKLCIWCLCLATLLLKEMTRLFVQQCYNKQKLGSSNHSNRVYSADAPPVSFQCILQVLNARFQLLITLRFQSKKSSS